MQVEYHVDDAELGHFIKQLDQAAVPRVGDDVVYRQQRIAFDVRTVAWEVAGPAIVKLELHPRHAAQLEEIAALLLHEGWRCVASPFVAPS